jgi:hypothetical protein
MKKLIFSMLTLALILSLVPAGMAKKPAPKLDCTIEYWWMPGWAGIISGDIEGVAIWPGGPMRFAGQTSHYGGGFEIYDYDGNLLLAGEGAGSTTVRHGKNSVWRSSGTVTDACEDMEDWIGRRVYQDGHFTWEAPGVPEHGTGTFRVN